jgi:hypothetical protein
LARAGVQKAKVTGVVTMRDVAQASAGWVRESLFKILIEFDCVAFDENSSRIRVDFVQKHRFKANDSFKPVC